ncbi:MAG: histidine kinase [Burkholderiales bacterium]|nr:histidine kinase [Burkholderiales bacterium]
MPPPAADPDAAARAGARPADFQPTLDDTATRPASLWPESAQAPRAGASTFAASRFDPRAEERARADAHAATAFDVCHPALALRAVLLVQVVLLAGTLLAAPAPAAWPSLAGRAGFAGLAGTLAWLVVVCALRAPLRRAAPALRAAAALALGAMAALLGALPLAAVELLALDAVRLAGLLLAGAGIAALLWAWLDLRARIWQPVDARVRLAELQSRIRPHFLFNALNTALALVRVDPERAEQVLEDLAQVFRVALADAGASVSLDEEIELAQRYLAIEQLRFGSRMQVAWDIEPGVGAARVPPLMLQPLVENAVRHGVEPAAEVARVWVQAGVRNGQAVVQVVNTVPQQAGPAGHGMAQHNVRERLRLLHDVAAQLDCWRDGALYRARIVIPL